MAMAVRMDVVSAYNGWKEWARTNATHIYYAKIMIPVGGVRYNKYAYSQWRRIAERRKRTENIKKDIFFNLPLRLMAYTMYTICACLRVSAALGLVVSDFDFFSCGTRLRWSRIRSAYSFHAIAYVSNRWCNKITGAANGSHWPHYVAR